MITNCFGLRERIIPEMSDGALGLVSKGLLHALIRFPLNHPLMI